MPAHALRLPGAPALAGLLMLLSLAACRSSPPEAPQGASQAAAVASVPDPGTEAKHRDLPQRIELVGEDCGRPGQPRCERYFIPDPDLGFRYRAGRYDIRVFAGDLPDPLRFSVDADDAGLRPTSADPDATVGLPEIWIFGGSFTWGFGVDAQETWPARVQAGLPGARVRNFGVVGYGNVHALVQLRRELAALDRSPPRIAVFAFSHFHVARNVGAPSVLRSFAGADGFHHPRAVLRPDGSVDIEMVPLRDPPDDPDPPAAEQRAVTVAIFEALQRLCAAHGITPVVAVQSARIDDPTVASIKHLGLAVYDLRVDHFDPRFNLRPHDGHPNAAGHALYAKKFLEALATDEGVWKKVGPTGADASTDREGG